jgi:hypothetical protein
MFSSLKLTSVTYIGREEEKKLSLIISYLIDMPEAGEFIHPVDWEGTPSATQSSNSTITPLLLSIR